MLLYQAAATGTALPHRAVPLGLLRDFSYRDAHLDVSWADSEGDVREAQRLRHQVLTMEMGACAGPDRLDAFCDHLIVRAAVDWHPGPVVGTYRVLTPWAAKRAGGTGMETVFDFSRLAALRHKLLELSSACVHADWRSEGVVTALWTALGQYMRLHRLDTMVGCIGMGLADGGEQARRTWQTLKLPHAVGPSWRTRPLTPLSAGQGKANGAVGAGNVGAPLPIVQSCLRRGGRLLGPPALNEAQNLADLPIALHLAKAA